MRFSAICALIKRKFTRLGRPSPKSAKTRFHRNHFGGLQMQKSLLKVGTKIVAQPQLGSTAVMAGSVVSYALRQLALGSQLKSGRMIVSLDNDLLKGANSMRRKFARRKHAKIVQRMLDVL